MKRILFLLITLGLAAAGPAAAKTEPESTVTIAVLKVEKQAIVEQAMELSETQAAASAGRYARSACSCWPASTPLPRRTARARCWPYSLQALLPREQVDQEPNVRGGAKEAGSTGRPVSKVQRPVRLRLAGPRCPGLPGVGAEPQPPQPHRRGLDPNRWFFNVEKVVAERVGSEPVRYVANINKYYVAYRLAFESGNLPAKK
jgi:hypothetical protein